jgi:hypothetical protein
MPSKSDKTENKFFDVAKPGQSSPTSTARPVIVGHKPQVEDPMMTRKVPVVSDEQTQDTPADETPSGAPAGDTPTMPSSFDRVDIKPVSPELQATMVEPEEEPKEELPKPVQPAVLPESTSESSVKDSITEAAKTDTQSPAMRKLEEEKEAKEEAARQEAIEKMIAEKKYFVPVGKAKRRRGFKRFLIFLFVILVLGLVGANFAIDAGLIETDIEPLTNLIKEQ